ADEDAMTEVVEAVVPLAALAPPSSAQADRVEENPFADVAAAEMASTMAEDVTAEDITAAVSPAGEPRGGSLSEEISAAVPDAQVPIEVAEEHEPVSVSEEVPPAVPVADEVASEVSEEVPSADADPGDDDSTVIDLRDEPADPVEAEAETRAEALVEAEAHTDAGITVGAAAGDQAFAPVVDPPPGLDDDI
ncbi:MAG: hypothetical protein AAGK32_10690, partial [Actinomycetota bacterium]